MKIKVQSVILDESDKIVFGADKFESKYIFVRNSTTEPQSKYIGIKIEPKRFNRLSHGRLSLKSCFRDSEPDDRLVSIIESFHTEFVANQADDVEFQVTSQLIPELQINPAGESVIALAMEENAPVISISFDVPEAYDKPKINLSTFVDVVDSLQKMMESAFQNSMKRKPAKYKRLYKGYKYDQLELMGFGPGSFTSYFRSAETVDLSGSSPTNESLTVLEELINPVNDRELSLAAIQKFKGHVVSAFKQFIGIIHELELNATLSWASPNSTNSYKKTLSKFEITPVYELLQETEDFEAEIKTIDGYLIKVNKKDGTWILKTDEGQEFRGFCCNNDVSLVDGLVVNNVKYRFVCREFMERNVATQKYKYRYELREKEVIAELDTDATSE